MCLKENMTRMGLVHTRIVMVCQVLNVNRGEDDYLTSMST